MAGSGQSGLANGSEGLVCFVCDVGVVGRYYALASCRTQTTKIRLIEKLGQLVGEDYMIVIAEDDIICRGCATMINSLDRLEKELGSIRSMVLRYLEKKYEMEEGELVNTQSNPAAPSVRPSIQENRNHPLDFQARKRRALMGYGEDEELNGTTEKDQSWLQCDRCKYTTNYNAFMVHHARSVHKKKDPPQSGSVQQQKQQQEQQQHIIVQSQTVQQEVEPLAISHRKKPVEEKTTSLAHIQRLQEEEVETITPDLEGTSELKKELESGEETVEMIAAEMEGNEMLDKGQMLTMVPVQMNSSSSKQVTLQAVEGEDGSNTLCMVDEDGIIVQNVQQAEDGTLYVQVPDGTDGTKQMLSVAEDGSVQMVEVLWDEISDQTNMVTF